MGQTRAAAAACPAVPGRDSRRKHLGTDMSKKSLNGGEQVTLLAAGSTRLNFFRKTTFSSQEIKDQSLIYNSALVKDRSDISGSARFDLFRLLPETREFEP